MILNEIFQKVQEKVAANPARVAGLTASYQFELSGDGGGIFHATFENGTYDIAAGAIANPGCTVSMAAADFVAMASGKLNPAAAFMTGKLKVKGDMAMAMKLQQLIS